MAEAVNTISNLGAAEQAVAGNQGVIFTAADREIIKRRVGEIEGRLSFSDRVRSLFGKTDALDEIRSSQDAALKPDRDYESIKNEAKVHRHLIKHRTVVPQEQVILSGEAIEERDGFKDREAQLERVKNYAQAFIKGAEDERAPELESLGNDKALREKLEKHLYLELYGKVKLKLESSVSDVYLTKLIWVLPNAKKVLDIFLPHQSMYLSSIERLKEHLSLKDLVVIARKLDIDLSSWLKGLNYESVMISEEYRKVETESRLKEYVPQLSRKLIRKVMSRVLTRRLFEPFRLWFEIRSIRSRLIEGGLVKEDLVRLERNGRKIAFLKVVVLLKKLHLRRAFSGTMEEFEKCSREIKYYNRKVGKLGFEISDEGLRWIKKNFEVLAFKIADYKLNLLQSMQTLGYEEKREGEIRRLEAAIARIRSHIR